MSNFLWEFYQQRQIVGASIDANRANIKATDAATKANESERRLDAMALTIMAMWSILEEKLGVTQAELVERMREIDLRDGKLDGKAAPTVSACPDCGRTMSTRHQRCVYCGTEALRSQPFAGF